MILDEYGKEVPAAPSPHKFGHFIIPEDCRVKGLGSLDETGSTRNLWGSVCTGKDNSGSNIAPDHR